MMLSCSFDLKMKSLIFLLLIPSFALATLDLSELYESAEFQLRNDLLTSFSSWNHKTKATDLEMEDRNAIFRLLVRTLMEKHGMKGEEAKIIAKRSIAENRKKQPFSPGGQSGKTAMVKMIDDQCIGNIPSCENSSTSPFRTINGQCNNLNHPFLGAMSTPFLREIQVDEEYNPKLDFNIRTEKSPCPTASKKDKDCKCKKRNKGKDCPDRKNLPSARTVSHNFHTNVTLPSEILTMMVATFGQFFDHDITFTPESDQSQCCSTPFDAEDNCFPIEVSENDAWYAPRDVTCLELSRSVDFCSENGGPRTQMNVITHYVDASNVYGSDDETAESIRSFQDGKLKTGDYDLLPVIDGKEKAGERRAFETPGLLTLHTLFLREHNRICDLIQIQHPDWNDEQIYQNARRILGAEMQSIVYGEWLPLVLGPSNVDKELKLKAKGTLYDPNVDPSMTTEFATAAFRFGHAMLDSLVKMFAQDNSGQVEAFSMAFSFFTTEKYYENEGQGMEQILMGLLNQPADSFDKEMTSAVTNQLAVNGNRIPEGKDFGNDLASRNIQRGRDHGIPGFCCYYRLYQDPKFKCNSGWKKKYEGFSDEAWDQLKTIYDCPSDIDLFTGGLAQAPLNDGITGQVFTKMLANQLKRVMTGDRFFFTHKGQVGSFSKSARRTLINRTLGSIICENTGITAVPPNAFLQSKTSDFVDCSQVPSLGDIDQLLEIDSD